MAAQKFFYNNNGVLTELAATEVSAGAGSGGKIVALLDSTGLLDVSMMPEGIGPVTLSILASEALASGDLVNIWNNSGTANVRKADASTTGKEAHGFVLTSVLASGTALVYADDMNTSVTGLTPGVQFLSDTTPGKCTTVVPSGTSHIVQRVGIAISATELAFTLEDYYVLA